MVAQPCIVIVSDLVGNPVDRISHDATEMLSEVGVVGGCSELCALLPNQIEDVICNLACDYLGVEEFVKEIEK